MDDNYLLTTDIAGQLYENTARDLPLIDYHNHLSVADLAENRQYEDIAEVWLLNDPYKHRAMRICGVEERLITGEGTHKDKFLAWCRTYPKLMGGPLYDWSAMEMRRIFGIHTAINGENGEKLWEEANEKLRSGAFCAQDLYHKFNIRYAAPCVSVTDDLKAFSAIESLAPSLRGDDLLTPTPDLAKRLSEKTKIPVSDQETFTAAVRLRLEALHGAGCRFSDHALDNGFSYTEDDGKNAARLEKALRGETLNREEQIKLTSDILRRLAEEYAGLGWTMQLHIGAQRFTSTRLRKASGGAGGFAGIGNCVDVSSLTRLLDDIEQGKNGLPKTILYTLNPADNAVMSVLSGSYVGVTQGPAWWWCDHLQGMRDMLDIFSNFSVLSTFVGMTTDSRSLLSMLRHDYFRRTFCGWAGEKVRRGELPNDMGALTELVTAVCYGNANKRIETV